MATLDEVRYAISTQNHDWIADETPIGKRFVKGRFSGFGLAYKGRDPGGGWRENKRALKQTMSFYSEPDPPVVDWGSTENDEDFLPKVRDQKNCGSCVAFATCSVIESRMKISKMDPDFSKSLSVAQLFFCSPNGDKCEEGWITGSALKFIRDNKGIGEFSEFPYRLTDKRCSEERKTIPPIVTVKNWRKVFDSEKRLNVIKERGPVIGGMHVHSDFLWYSSGVYRPTTSEIVGLHAIAIVGYDKNKGAWIVLNSWGRNWGKGGVAYIGFGSCGIDSEFGFYDVNIKIV